MKNQAENIYRKADRFASLTKTLIMNGNISRAKKCFAVAEQLLVHGSNETKSIISNGFVYSVSIFMEFHNCSIKNLFPKSLLEEYSRQTNTSGI